MLTGKKILITGATGLLARPVANALSRENEVWCLGRFEQPQSREALEAEGVRTHRWDMGADGLDDLARDFTHVLHAGVVRDASGLQRNADGSARGRTAAGVNEIEHAVRANASGVGVLMEHCRSAEAFLFVSTFGVYSFIARDHLYEESDPIGGYTPFMPSYGPAKIAAEGAVIAMARALGLPSIIARMNVCYGPYGHGGLPMRHFGSMRRGEPIKVAVDGADEWLSPIHTDDVVRQTPLLWRAASTQAPIVNWAGDEAISIRQLVDHMSELSGVPARFEEAAITIAPTASNNHRRKAMIGDCQTSWREGLAKTMQAYFPGSIPLA